MAKPTITIDSAIPPPKINTRQLEAFAEATMRASQMAAIHAYGHVFCNSSEPCHGCGYHRDECVCTPETLYRADGMLTASGVTWRLSHRQCIDYSDGPLTHDG